MVTLKMNVHKFKGLPCSYNECNPLILPENFLKDSYNLFLYFQATTFLQIIGIIKIKYRWFWQFAEQLEKVIIDG